IALAAAAIAAPNAHSTNRDVGPVTNDLYVKECGACHMAYSPAWLPERSWRRIMSTLGNHFNENAELKSGESQRILDYLTANAAERSSSVRSREVLASLRG